jgi:FdhD protein
VAIGAPSSLAIEIAEENDITLVGFINHNSFNVYTHAHSIQ